MAAKMIRVIMIGSGSDALVAIASTATAPVPYGPYQCTAAGTAQSAYYSGTPLGAGPGQADWRWDWHWRRTVTGRENMKSGAAHCHCGSTGSERRTGKTCNDMNGECGLLSGPLRSSAQRTGAKANTTRHRHQYAASHRTSSGSLQCDGCVCMCMCGVAWLGVCAAR